jgi:hypothetical protein
VGVQRIDADTAESTAGVGGCCAVQPRWRRRGQRLRVPVRLGGSLRWASIWQPTRHGAFCRTRSTSTGSCRSVRILLCCCGLRSSCWVASTGPRLRPRLHNVSARFVGLEWEAHAGVCT